MPQRDQSRSVSDQPLALVAHQALSLPSRGINVGLIAEHLAAAALAALGYEVTYPAPAEAPYDLTVCRVTAAGRERSQTVQVKWVGSSRNGLRLQRGRRKAPDNKRYAPGDFDLLAVVRRDRVYLIPFTALEGRVTITVTSHEWEQYRLPLAIEQMELLADARRTALVTNDEACSDNGVTTEAA